MGLGQSIEATKFKILYGITRRVYLIVGILVMSRSATRFPVEDFGNQCWMLFNPSKSTFCDLIPTLSCFQTFWHLPTLLSVVATPSEPKVFTNIFGKVASATATKVSGRYS